MSNFMVNPSVWTTEYVKKADYRSIDRADEYLGYPTAFRIFDGRIEVFFKKLGYWINFKNLEECKALSKCSAYDGNGAEYCPVERGLVD